MNAAIWLSKICETKQLMPKYFSIKINGNNRQNIVHKTYVKHLDCRLYYQQLHLKFLCNLARYWLQAAWGWHNSAETCSGVIICEIIVNLLVSLQNKCWYDVRKQRRAVTIFKCVHRREIMLQPKPHGLICWLHPAQINIPVKMWNNTSNNTFL